MDYLDPPKSTRLQQKRAARSYSIEDLRVLAKRRLPRAVFDFFDGGADDETSLNANLQAYKSRFLVPRYLVDVSEVNTSCQILGRGASLPIAVSPTGGIGFGWNRGDIAVARAAGEMGIPYTLPTSATVSIEKLARAAPDTRLWFQAYMLRKRGFTMELIERAKNAGYEALVVTVDMPTGGKRERDLRNDFGLPFRFTPKNLLDFSSRPGWAVGILRNGVPVIENMLGFTPDATNAAGIVSSVGKNYDPSFDWSAFREVRRKWSGKLLLKGLLHPEDALRAVEHGCDGIIVSNHGGRQLDGAVATLNALAPIAQAVSGRAEVFVDGGIRRGSDILKALAFGADAVMVGRPLLYGVCAAGQVGAVRALEILKDELLRAMRLSGVTDVNRVDGSFISCGIQQGECAPATRMVSLEAVG